MGRKYFETTEEQFKIFVDEATYWIDFFGLVDAEINFDHCNVDDSGFAGGCCSGDGDNRVFWLTFEKEMIDDGNGNFLEADDVRCIAAHEVLEVLLHPLRHMAVGNGVSWQVVDREVHRIIRTMENVLIKPIIYDNEESEGGCNDAKSCKEDEGCEECKESCDTEEGCVENSEKEIREVIEDQLSESLEIICDDEDAIDIVIDELDEMDEEALSKIAKSVDEKIRSLRAKKASK